MIYTIRKDTKKSFLDKLLILLADLNYKIKNGFLRQLQNLLFNNKNILERRKILIFRTGSMGDSICALPAIFSIRKNFPEAKIDILTNAGAENLVSLGGLIDKSLVNEIIDYRILNKKNLYSDLNKRNYDLFIEIPQNYTTLWRELRNIFIAKTLGAKSGFGWEIGANRFLASVQEKYFKFISERDRYLNLIEQAGLKNYGLHFPLGMTKEIKSKIEGRIKACPELVEGTNNVGMVVGAKRPQNRWPIEYFKEVADYLLKQNKNILLFGGPEDFELAEQIKGDNVFNYCGKLTPIETAEMMKHCRLVISNDTGPMHLAYAVDTSLIAIFSGRDYANKWFPPEKCNIAIARNYLKKCLNCFDTPCDNSCLRSIKPKYFIDKIPPDYSYEFKK